MTETKEVKSYSQMRRDFYKMYYSSIVPFVQQYEDKRKSNLFLAIILSSILFILGSAVVYFGHLQGGFFDKENDNVYEFACILYSFSYFSWYWIKKKFENSIKEKIMPELCKCFGDMKWSHGKYLYGENFSAAGIIPVYRAEEYDDIFEGSYKDVKIEIVEAKYKIGNRKKRRTVFSGVMIKLDMNKKFTGHTIIKPNGLINKSPIAGLKYTELEDPEFNKKFDVYTNDEIDARYLITPSFMQRLKNIKTAFKASKESCAFYGEELTIALYTKKDLFSICSLIKKVDDIEQYTHLCEEIISIIKLIEYFKLDQKTGL